MVTLKVPLGDPIEWKADTPEEFLSLVKANCEEKAVLITSRGQAEGRARFFFYDSSQYEKLTERGAVAVGNGVFYALTEEVHPVLDGITLEDPSLQLEFSYKREINKMECVLQYIGTIDGFNVYRVLVLQDEEDILLEPF